MSNTSKNPSSKDANQTLQGAYNDVNATLSVDSFIVSKVGHKVEQTITTTSIANDTEVLTFKDGSTTLYVLTIIYTDGTRDVMLSAERTA